MGIFLTTPNPKGGTTDHSQDIARMRSYAGIAMSKYGDPLDAPMEDNFRIYICMAAAALLEVHDDSGISLDDWLGPRELVEIAMNIVGLSPTDFIENGV